MRFLPVLLLLIGVTCIRIAKEEDIKVPFPPMGWINTGRANGTQLIALVFALKQSNLGELEQTLFRVSDPRHLDYGKHLSLEEVDALTAPPQEAVELLLAFLAQHHADQRLESHSRFGMVRTVVSIATAEAMLDTKYYSFIHIETGKSAIRTSHYSLPSDLAPHVNIVGPTIRFPSLRRPKIMEPTVTNTPSSLRALYSVGNVEGKAPANRQACSAFLEQYMSPSDLQEFYKLYYPIAIGRTAVIVGPNNARPVGIEANLDIQFITALGGNVVTEFDSFPGRAPDNPVNEPFLDMLYYLGNDSSPPWLVSTSYGEDESSVSDSYAGSCNTEFQKSGARGISLLFASGDSGVGSDSGACTQFAAQWPSASPYVTAVGGTENVPEVGAGLSSGGFSNRWPQQPWQADAINTFLKTSNALPNSSLYNASGRGFPDVAAQATGFTIVYNGVPLPGVAGTSCSSPTFSGIIGLLNDLRFQAGKSPLGFLNPLIYQTAVSNPTAFQDITSGNNPGCGTRGFTATKGWDPVTGYGTPNYAELAKVVSALL